MHASCRLCTINLCMCLISLCPSQVKHPPRSTASTNRNKKNACRYRFRFDESQISNLDVMDVSDRWVEPKSRSFKRLPCNRTLASVHSDDKYIQGSAKNERLNLRGRCIAQRLHTCSLPATPGSILSVPKNFSLDVAEIY